MFRAALLATLIACGQGNGPSGEQRPKIRPVASDGALDTTACSDALQTHVRNLYEAAAPSEGIAKAALADYLEANREMVMNDCRANPPAISECVLASQSVARLESDCLITLDDEGETEAQQFGR